ncbi:MAG: WecB/TagA/CpsF family glycosyltransferase [Leadbetterella sp.]|nr:WecB/TagA/CpsF family glycosyltransferase [Leadbetterella sp.]
MNEKSLLKHKLISINISLGNFETFIKKIVDLGQKKQSTYVCVANVHMCIETYRNSAFADIVNHAVITTPDGMPLVKALKWLYGVVQEKVSGPDLMPRVLKAAEQEGLKVYFYGSTQPILEKLDAFCMDHFPNLSLAGVYSPPFRVLTDAETLEDIKRINDSDANIVFVALGCPKQERWMASMKGKINAVMIGVGGAFPMLVGVEKRAPLWMQHNGLEWFYRLIQDPQRLFKRYLVTNTSFLYLVFKEKLKFVR